LPHRYYYRDQAVSEKDCDEFIDKYKNAKFDEGLIGDPSSDKGLTKNIEYRKAKVHWLGNNDLLVRALWSYVLEMNQNFWQLNLEGYQSVQLTKYDDGCYYGWHKDELYNSDTPRKLSAVLQLSRPEDYIGCELQLFNGEREPEELPIKQQGSLIVFKADEWHRVTKLIEGTRYSLVMWITGPQLR